MAKPARTKGKLPGLQTHHVFLDTQVYHSQGHNPASPLLTALAEQLAADRLVLHITDITLAEIERQLKDFVGETDLAVKKARKLFGRWRKRLPKLLPHDLPDFDSSAIAAAAFKSFYDAISRQWKVVEHDATNVAAFEIFQAYFRRDAPFEKIGSKEFPDAFVLRALEKWCVDNKERMYVIGADIEMTKAVETTEVLLPMQHLPALLQSLAATATPDIITTTDALLSKPRIKSALQVHLETKINELIPIYSGDQLADGEVSDHGLYGDIEVINFTVLAASDDTISVLLDVKAPLLVHVDFEDRSMAWYDREDGIYVGGESASTEILENVTIRAFVKLGRKPLDVVNFQLMTSEINIYDPPDEYDY